jgi:ketosteroid isomerase-like protein
MDGSRLALFGHLLPACLRDTSRAMSQQNVELVRRLQLLPESELTTLFRDESSWAELKDSLEPFVEPDCQFVWIAWEQRFKYTGVDGLREGWLEWFEPWASYYSEAEDIFEVGDQVVVLARDRGRRPETDIEVELLGASVCTVRNGKLAQVEFYASRAEALEAAGLSEQDAHADSS